MGADAIVLAGCREAWIGVLADGSFVGIWAGAGVAQHVHCVITGATISAWRRVTRDGLLAVGSGESSKTGTRVVAHVGTGIRAHSRVLARRRQTRLIDIAVGSFKAWRTAHAIVPIFSGVRHTRFSTTRIDGVAVSVRAAVSAAPASRTGAGERGESGVVRAGGTVLAWIGVAWVLSLAVCSRVAEDAGTGI